MLFQSTILAVPLAAFLLACNSAQDEILTANATQSTQPVRGPDAEEAKGKKIQLAQYPGAPFEDRNGNLWFATVLKGLIRYDGEEFVTFGMADGLASNLVRDIVEAEDGTLWIGTGGGVSLYDGTSFKTLTNYGDTPITKTFGEQGDHRDIWDIRRDSKGNWWITTLDGVFRYDGESFTPFPMPVVAKRGAYEFTPKMVYSIYEDKSGALWFGTDGAGAVRYDGTDMVVYTAEQDGLCSDRICKIFEDSRGVFWFGSSGGGVSKFDGTSFTTHLRTKTFSKHSGWGRYMAIMEDRQGYVWFGASHAGGGVHRWDGESFRYFSVEDGLGGGGVPSIREDRKGNLWFGTTAGVFRFDGERFINFTKTE